MKLLKKSLLLIVLPLVAFTAVHKFYVSVTNVNYSEKDKAIQITSRLFIDDLEEVMAERYGIESKLATDAESVVVDEYIEKYFNAKFLVYLDGEQKSYSYLGKKYDNDVIVCYLEINNIEIVNYNKIAVLNELLTDLFEEQQNVVHFKIKDKKKSFVLIRENNKGLLKL